MSVIWDTQKNSAQNPFCEQYILASRPEFGRTAPIFQPVSRIPNRPENVLNFTTCPYFHKD